MCNYVWVYASLLLNDKVILVILDTNTFTFPYFRHSVAFVFQFNFVGKLLGPRGNSLKRLQEETGAKMSILGKGSMRDKAKVLNFEVASQHVEEGPQYWGPCLQFTDGFSHFLCLLLSGTTLLPILMFLSPSIIVPASCSSVHSSCVALAYFSLLAAVIQLHFFKASVRCFYRFVLGFCNSLVGHFLFYPAVTSILSFILCFILIHLTDILIIRKFCLGLTRFQ